MGISGIGGMSSIGAISGVQSPYLYNTNRISSASLNPIAPIGPDVVRAPKTDYSSMAGLSGIKPENENPLKPFQSSDFDTILEKQFALSQQNAARLLGE